MRLKELRKNKKLTQEEVGNMIHVNKMTYNGYENENREPSIETLCKLADLYNVSLDYLVGRVYNNEIGYLTEEQKNVVYVLKKLNDKNLNEILSNALRLLDNQK